MDNVFFCNSGCEANEAAIKLARLYGHHRNVDNPAIIVMDNAFHGRTLATLSATGNRKVQAGFEKRAEQIHVISQLLKAYCLYEKDVQYVVQDNKVIIVDENTGRLMTGRRWSDGLHQAVEAKENALIEEETQTYATITIQNYFRLYEKLAGMTGTAETEAQEFHDIYKLGVLVIPTNRQVKRQDRHDTVYKTRREKYAAVLREIQEIHGQGRPILVGTISVEVCGTRTVTV